MTYGAPRFDRPIDVDEHVRALPHGASCKGLFFNDPIARLRRVDPRHPILASSEIAGRRYVPFFDYPYADFMRLIVATARAVYPSAPLGEGLRRLGGAGYQALLESQVGKVLFGVFGSSFSQVARVGARGWAVSVSFGRVELEDVGERHIRYHFRDLPAFLETYQVGAVEGAMRACGVEGEVRVDLRDLGDASFDVQWAAR
ncbi:DUF2378 family protein [Sandaracinus amylolyticus]|uniref:DUF2378 family protein n=1 Tax=Sandaracinus amylolyticus TaxID=927083 RepID=A0A0F6VZS2_9BACT|nr:DUF2378 family protein [Sandaracinus amylolyticus]AKF03798.1 hypothetical protein DB32_000947 [Sandaracinus amylolyticus]